MSVRSLLNKYPRIRQLAGKLYSQIPSTIRLGKDFWWWFAFLKESETWSYDELQNYQIETLKNLLKEISRSSAFYENILKGVEINRISSYEEFRSLIPTISTDEYIDNYYRIYSSAHVVKKIQCATSGTTGKALRFYTNKADDSREWAAVCHQWGRVGYVPGKSRRAEFRGLTRNNNLVDHYPERNMIRFSILQLSPKNVIYYGEIIRKNRLDFFHGFPSALYLLSSTIIDNKIDFPQPQAILLASEEVHDYQLSMIQKCFPETKLYSHYGCAERTVLAGWCEYNRHYHVLPQYSIVEVDSANNEIIGTNLFNLINPFVRYRMTDTVMEVYYEPCPDCGRRYIPRFSKLGGRTEDTLFSLEKGWIPSALMTYPLKRLRFLNEVQFLQSDKSTIMMKYSLRRNTCEDDIKHELGEIKCQYQELLGADTKLEFERVDGFLRTASGKFKWIISSLKK